MYARQHSPLLLQVTATNPFEAWHRKLKAGPNLSKGQVALHGLYDMCTNIIQAVRDTDTRAATAAYQFRRKNLSVCMRGYPEIAGFLHPFQKMLSIELGAAPERIAAGKLTPMYEGDTLTCYCRFARRYLLPCIHVFHLDSEIKVSTPGKWVSYICKDRL